MTIILLILGLVLFVGLVVIHEFGHFIMARRNGVEVEEFGIGFPPLAWSRRLKSGLLFSINWLPLGGFVRLKGEHDADTAKGSYGRASLKGKTQIMMAGVFMNLVTALVLLTILALTGMPKVVENQFTVASDTKTVRNDVIIGYIEPGSPAEKAGLKVNDTLRTIVSASNDERLQDSSQYLCIGTADKSNAGAKCVSPNVISASILPDLTEKNAGKLVLIAYERKGEQLQSSATLRTNDEVAASKKTDNPKGYLGIVPSELTLRRSTWSAPVVAVGFSAQLTKLTIQGLGKALKGLGSTIAGIATFNSPARRNGQTQASAQVSGPLGIFFIFKDGADIGLTYILFIVAILSLTLAIMNFLPIPALDGGRLFVTLLFRAIRKPLTKSREEWIHGSGFAFLMFLFVLITIVDYKRNF